MSEHVDLEKARRIAIFMQSNLEDYGHVEIVFMNRTGSRRLYIKGERRLDAMVDTIKRLCDEVEELRNG